LEWSYILACCIVLRFRTSNSFSNPIHVFALHVLSYKAKDSVAIVYRDALRPVLFVDAMCAVTVLLCVLCSACAAVPDVAFHYRYDPLTAPLNFNTYISDANAATLVADSFSNFVKILYNYKVN
jgi:hypothetical protein